MSEESQDIIRLSSSFSQALNRLQEDVRNLRDAATLLLDEVRHPRESARDHVDDASEKTDDRLRVDGCLLTREFVKRMKTAFTDVVRVDKFEAMFGSDVTSLIIDCVSSEHDFDAWWQQQLARQRAEDGGAKCPVCGRHPIAPGRDTCVDCSH